MTEHELKTWPDGFQAMYDGHKTFELRHNDRDFQEGDHLRLREWEPNNDDDHPDDPDGGEYTGRELLVEVTHMIGNDDMFGAMLQDGCCVMAVEFLDRVYGEDEDIFGLQKVSE